MIALSDGEMLRAEHLPPELGGPTVAGGEAPTTFQEQRVEAERRIVLAALERNGWHITRTAESLRSRRPRQPTQDHAAARHSTLSRRSTSYRMPGPTFGASAPLIHHCFGSDRCRG